MLLQSLLLIVTLALLGSALLTSTLVSAKSAFHAVVMRQSRSAMTDATASFVSWAQNNVKQSGIDQLPVWAATPPIDGPQPVCEHPTSVPSNGVSADCILHRRVKWNITGYTSVSAAQTSVPLTSAATNLATAQNERRISATVTVAITDSTGAISYASESREITARLFHAFPYVVITGERDASSEAGSVISSEGDTAGHLDQTVRLSSDPSVASYKYTPAEVTDTTLVTTIDCINTVGQPAENYNENAAAFISLRRYGNLAWSFETPCIPRAPVNLSSAPKGYEQPTTSKYGTNATESERWTKGDDSNSTFPH